MIARPSSHREIVGYGCLKCSTRKNFIFNNKLIIIPVIDELPLKSTYVDICISSRTAAVVLSISTLTDLVGRFVFACNHEYCGFVAGWISLYNLIRGKVCV